MDNIEMNLTETVWENMDWIRPLRLLIAGRHGNKPFGSIKGEEFLG